MVAILVIPQYTFSVLCVIWVPAAFQPKIFFSQLPGGFAVFAVHRELGPGLLEQCYHNALYYELAGRGLQVVYNAPFSVFYKGNVVGNILPTW